jgi:hypothetical protein
MKRKKYQISNSSEIIGRMVELKEETQKLVSELKEDVNKQENDHKENINKPMSEIKRQCRI